MNHVGGHSRTNGRIVYQCAFCDDAEHDPHNKMFSAFQFHTTRFDRKHARLDATHGDINRRLHKGQAVSKHPRLQMSHCNITKDVKHLLKRGHRQDTG